MALAKLFEYILCLGSFKYIAPTDAWYRSIAILTIASLHLYSPFSHPVLSHSSRRQLNELNSIKANTKTSLDSNGVVTPTFAEIYHHDPSVPRVPLQCFTPSHEVNTKLRSPSPAGRETYRLSEHNTTGITMLDEDQISSRDMPPIQAGHKTGQNGLNDPVNNAAIQPGQQQQQKQSTDMVNVGAVNSGVFYAPSISTSESGLSQPFRLVDHAAFDGAHSSQFVLGENKYVIFSETLTKN